MSSIEAKLEEDPLTASKDILSSIPEADTDQIAQALYLLSSKVKSLHNKKDFKEPLQQVIEATTNQNNLQVQLLLEIFKASETLAEVSDLELTELQEVKKLIYTIYTLDPRTLLELIKEYQDLADLILVVLPQFFSEDLTKALEMLNSIPDFSEIKEQKLFESAVGKPKSKKTRRVENFDPEVEGQRLEVGTESLAYQYKTHLGKAWYSFLSNSVPQKKQAIKVLTKKGIPRVQEPLIFSDFLLKCFGVGGSTSVMALSGLFKLMTQYNLESKKYYSKLYELLKSELSSGKVLKSGFLKIVELSLASSMLPATLIASFVKVLMQESLRSSLSNTLWALSLALNCFRTHSGLTQMVQNTLVEDPFLREVTDPFETKAINSSLWEILVLKKHYHYRVRGLASQFEVPRKKIQKTNPSHEMLFETSMKKPKLRASEWTSFYN